MKSAALACAFSLACLFAGENASAAGSKDEMRSAMVEFARSSFVIGSLSLTAGVGGTAGWWYLTNDRPRSSRWFAGVAMYGFALVQILFSTQCLFRGRDWLTDDYSYLERVSPRDFIKSEIGIMSVLGPRYDKAVDAFLIADAAFFTLSLPLYYPWEPFKDLKSMAIVFTAESLLSAGLGLAWRYSLNRYFDALSSYGGMDLDGGSMKPQGMPPFMIRAGFGF